MYQPYFNLKKERACPETQSALPHSDPLLCHSAPMAPTHLQPTQPILPYPSLPKSPAYPTVRQQLLPDVPESEPGCIQFCQTKRLWQDKNGDSVGVSQPYIKIPTKMGAPTGRGREWGA